MRILHTSDWHLGMMTGTVSRLPDQQDFLDWLVGVIAQWQVDAMVVAGDVFDSMQPSAEAQAAYYGFLARLPRTGVRDVVVVGGNHDSPSRLDAPREVLAALAVRVVGGLPEAPLETLVYPLRRRGHEEPAAVCLAVPFVHEYRLGVRTTEPDRVQVRQAFLERFGGLYRDLVDRALATFPGLPIVATGHLTVGSVQPEDYRDPIHQVGFIGALPPSVLDRRIAYAALGHIHRAFPVVEGRAWYSGSPLQVSVSDGAGDRKVILVDLREDGGPPVVKPMPVPVFRELRAVEGTLDEVVRALEEMESPARHPPLVQVVVRLDRAVPGLGERLAPATQGRPKGRRPQIVEVREVWQGAVEPIEKPCGVALEQMSEEEVFSLLCRMRGEGNPEELAQVFRTIATMSDEDLTRLLAAIHGDVAEVP